jgi:antitoxin VapB
METAKLFNNGRSQAVRLPKAYRFEGSEVYIKKVAGGVLLISKNQSVWDLWEKNLLKHDTPFMMERNQPDQQQERERIDYIFIGHDYLYLHNESKTSRNYSEI